MGMLMLCLPSFESMFGFGRLSATICVPTSVGSIGPPLPACVATGR